MMAGLLNAEKEQAQMQPEAAPKQGGEMQDPILKQVEDGIEAAVPPELKKQYMAIMVSGMKVMFSKETSQFMEQRLQQSGDPVAAVSNGIADLLALIQNEAMPKGGDKMALQKFSASFLPAAMLAAFALMAQALDYAEKVGAVEVTPELIEQVTDATWQAVTAKFGISREQIDQVIAQAQGGQGGQQEVPPAQPPGQGAPLEQPMGA